jgi:outer membrane protein assembly factor BamA
VKPFFLVLTPFLCLLAGLRAAAQQDSIPARHHTRSILVFPVLARSIETGWSFGSVVSGTYKLAKHDTLTRTSNAQGLALYSLQHQFIAAINGAVYFPGEEYILNHQVSYSSFPDKFWGLGRYTPDSAQESYKFSQYYIYLHLMKKIGRSLFAGVLYEQQDVLHTDYRKGGLFDREKISGRNGYFISGMGLSLTWDNRNNAFAPDKGFFAQAYFNHFAPFLGSEDTYTNIVIDLRSFMRLYRSQVLAMQLFSFSNLGNVPLRSLASFGGANSMRGFYDGRYKDKQQLVFQTEYRVPVYGKWGVVVFGGAGDVAHKPTDYVLSALKYSYGGGLRYALNKTEKLNLRMDYGIAGNHNKGLYFQLGEAF